MVDNYRVFVLGALWRGRLSGGELSCREVTCPRSGSEAVAELENNMRCAKNFWFLVLCRVLNSTAGLQAYRHRCGRVVGRSLISFF